MALIYLRNVYISYIEMLIFVSKFHVHDNVDVDITFDRNFVFIFIIFECIIRMYLCDFFKNHIIIEFYLNIS